MNLVFVAARISLAAVFGIAGVAKLRDRTGTREAVANFGVPAALSAPFALMIPASEVAIAACLLSPWAAPAALAAALLLSAFTLAMLVNLAFGRKPDCRCFGQLRSSRIGVSSVVRNVTLGALAGAVYVRPGQITLVTGAYLFGLGVVAAQTIVLWQLFRQQGRLLLRIEQLEGRIGGIPSGEPAAQGLPIGSPAPRIAVDSIGRPDRPMVIIFSDPGCPACAAMLPEVRRWQSHYAEALRIALVTRDTDRAVHDMRVLEGLRDVVLQTQHEIADLFRVQATPAAVLVRADGTIGSEPALGREAIEALLSSPTAGVN